MDKQVLIIKGADNQSKVAQILFENGYTVRLTTVTPDNASRKIKALEYWKNEEK